MIRTGCALGFLTICGIEDLRRKEISWGLIVIGAVVAGMLLTVKGEQLWQYLGGAAVGALLTGMAFLTREAIGYGDGAAVAVAGMMLGFSMILEIVLTALGAAAVVSAVLLMLRKAGRKKELPFLPFLACGAWFCVITEAAVR